MYSCHTRAQLINSTELQLSVGAGNGIKFTYPSDQQAVRPAGRSTSRPSDQQAVRPAGRPTGHPTMPNFEIHIEHDRAKVQQY